MALATAVPPKVLALNIFSVATIFITACVVLFFSFSCGGFMEGLVYVKCLVIILELLFKCDL